MTTSFLRTTLPAFCLLFILAEANVIDDLLKCYQFPKSDKDCPNDDVNLWYYNQEISEAQEITPESVKRLPIQNGTWEILFHGYTSSKDGSPNPTLLKAYRDRGTPVNVIVVNARKPFSEKPGHYLCYGKYAMDNMKIVARCIASQLINLMDQKVLPPAEQLHFIGHSLGAHTASIVANILKKRNRGIIARITGLDPAGPLFRSVYRNLSEVLDASDATFVDNYHSDAGVVVGLKQGTVDNLGTVDVWFNGGTNQPGCKGDTVCSHHRAIDYYAETIYPQPPEFRVFMGAPKSTGLIQPEIFFFPSLVGEYMNQKLKGVFDVVTNDKEPFAKDINPLKKA